MPTLADGDASLELLALLRAARETGALDALVESAGTAEAVAEAAGVDVDAATVLVETLTDEGFLRVVGGEYEPTNRALGFLATRDLRSVGRLPHALDRLDDYLSLSATMRGEDDASGREERRRNRLGSDTATPTATVRARVTAAVRAAPGAESAVDLRGQSGVHAREFAARGVATTLVESEGVVEAVRPLLAPTDVGVATEMPKTNLDLVFGVDVASRHDPTEVSTLLETAASALDGGTLVLVEAVRGQSSAATAVAVESLATGGAGVRTAEEHRIALTAAGFDEVDVRAIPGTDRAAVVGHRGVD